MFIAGQTKSYPNFDIHDERHKMIPSSKGAEFSRKQDENSNKTKASSSSTSPWLKQKDPRIVRVSRAFGGKDRHSKVCTVRGLRDRRVRLSVPTAIQLYDLQDRLGLNQPSKVVDWLLNAAKDEIDELPPLQMPLSGNFLHHPVLSFHQDHQDVASPMPQERSKISTIIDWEDPFGLPKSNMWISNSHLSSKSKEAAERENASSEKQDWNKRNEQEKEVGGGFEGSNGEQQQGQVLLSNFFPIGNNPNSSLPSFLTNVLPYGSFYHLEPSNYSLSQFGSSQQQHGTSSSQGEDFHSFNVLPLQSATVPFGSHVYISPPPLAAATQSYFHSHSAAMTDCDPREVSHFQTSSSFANSLTSSSYSISQLMRPSFHLSMAPVQHDEDGRQETSN